MGGRSIEVRRLAASWTTEPATLRALTSRYLIWDAYTGGAPRVELHPLVLSAELHAQAVAVAEGAVRVLDGPVAARAFAIDDEREPYGFHPDVLRLMRASRAAGDEASLMRVDLLLGSDGKWRVCEINADCPGGHNEAFGLPRLARRAGFSEAESPTHVVERLCDRLGELASRPSGRPGAIALLFATAYAEDLQVCAFLQRKLRARGLTAILAPPDAPRGCGDGELCLGDTPLAVLYRYFPTEYMEGQRNLGAIARAISDGKLRTLTSFAHMFTQSKLVMARAWAARAALAPDDAALIAAHVPETFDAADVARAELTGDRERWVLKKTLGRVGDEVYVGALTDGDDWAAIVDEIAARRRLAERWIAQRFVEQAPVVTPWGDRLVTLGAYVLDGKFAGYFARITPESHVSHDALVVPVFAEAA